MAELTAAEQLLLELVNRARLDPLGEAKRLGINLNTGLKAGTLSGTAKQVLAPSDFLKDSSLAHSEWMLATDVFSHTGEGGSNAGTRMGAAGYQFTGSWAWGENIAWVGTTATPDLVASTLKIHDNLFKSAGHRLNILSDNVRELGTGIAEGQFTYGTTTYNAVMATENFARAGTHVFVTGVALNDADEDNFYDIGEGRGGVTVTVFSGGLAEANDTTGSAGGYAVSTAGGTVDVVFSGGDLATDVIVTVEMGAKNAKVDVVGQDEVLSSVNTTLGAGAHSLVLLGIANLTGTGSANADRLQGNAGSNYIYGMDGDDILAGWLGKDYLTGGAGLDVFDYNAIAETGKTVATRDRILDFSVAEDVIDLSSIDAYTKALGDQEFVFRGILAFSGGAGQIRYVKQNLAGTVNDRTLVYGDVDGNRTIDFHIEIAGLVDLTADNFIL